VRSVEILEREEPLAALRSWLTTARSGAGRLVLVAGEAGIGKTTLVRTFCDEHPDQTRVWWGGCDALSTPRPLGPLYDIARVARGELASLMASDASQHERFVGFLQALAWPLGPTVAVIEDVHWADEATRDLLVFVARRIADVNALVVVTYRDDEVGAAHPLREVLGNVATLPAVERLSLAPLSEAAVVSLVARKTDATHVHRVTGGNPFFVTEVLAAGDDDVPATVADAVLARLRRVSSPARRVVEAASVVPDEVEVALVEAMTGAATEVIDECLQTGVLSSVGRRLRFRHELARLAVEASLPELRRVELHARVLAWLREHTGVDPARLAYHADEAGDRDAVVEYAPAAAEQAARLGAHHEAVAHYERALQHAHLLDLHDHVDLLERYARECQPVGRVEDAYAATGRALELIEELGDIEAAARMSVRRAVIAWKLARPEEVRQLTSSALAMLEARGPGPTHADVYGAVAGLRMLARDIPGAIDLGLQAIQLAERSDDPSAMAQALGAVGAAQWFVVPDEAEPTMVRALENAHRSGEDRQVAAVLGNLGSGAGEVRRYATADRWLAECISWTGARDLDGQLGYALAWSARSAFEQGRWMETTELLHRSARAVIEDHPTQIVLLTTRGRLRARRGDPGVGEPLQAAWELAEATGDLQRLWPVAAGRAEAAWLDGRTEEISSLVGDTLELAVRLGHGWAIGELGFWLWRGGQLQEPPEGAAQPFALQIAGEWRAAAAAWEEVGCPYEVAVALADGDDPDELRRAFTILAELGAAPMGDRVAAQLRELGVRDLPRRPSRATLDNPGGLTDRQLEVLALLVEGCTNPQIAARLHISPKTAGHHVSAILDRLGAADRREAANLARQHGLLAE
jgi:DNA-binding CsgD family transcriptional regulator/tetratricopeptide (TPR) repeat protein